VSAILPFAGGAPFKLHSSRSFSKRRKKKDDAVVAVLPRKFGKPHLVRQYDEGSYNLKTLSARYLTDLQEHWMVHGKDALDRYCERFPDRYVENYAMLTRVIKVEADVKHSMATPKTVDEALAELESKVGSKGRKKFEKFLREVAEDEDEDVIEVTPK
jgi:hypothetical protein